jgi:hypothetical protein
MAARYWNKDKHLNHSGVWEIMAVKQNVHNMLQNG